LTIRQRAHHFLCTLISIGKGHTPAFAGNDDKIVVRLFPKPAMAICGCNFPHCDRAGAGRDAGFYL
jgi:hypothetical protein